MANSHRWTVMLVYAAVSILPTSAAAQHSSDSSKPSPEVPLSSGEQPPAKIIVDPPLNGPLASRRLAIIHYCSENLRIVPVFGSTAASVSPRIGHIHVSVDDSSWVWADASRTLQGLSPGQHKVCIDLVDANHQFLKRRDLSVTNEGVRFHGG